jgi:N-acyl-D-aspartate/D-glutamate deacylase
MDLFDLLIRNAKLVDGTGVPARIADLGVMGDRIAEIGRLPQHARRTIDAQGQILSPGFIDVHTHYDAQVFWDPTLSPSCFHGVTTVLAGNCGFSIAPLSKEAAPYLLRMLARVEGMPVTSLQTGVPWDWDSFGDYLGRLEGRVGVNTAFMCGHSALRRVVMGERALHAKASPEELESMKALLAKSLREGAMGFSTSRSPSHNDADGNPVPSNHAAREEILALARVCRDHPGTILEIAPGVGAFSEDEIALMTDMSLAAERSINWNVIAASPGNAAFVEHQLAASDRARKAGAQIVPLAIASASSGTRINLHSGFVFDGLPGWAPTFRLSVPERIAAFRDPKVRRELEHSAEAARATLLRGFIEWDNYFIGDSRDKSLVDQRVGDIAERQGKTPFDAMFDIAIADELRTVFVRREPPPTDETKSRRAALWLDDRVIIGGSDAGAHLDMNDTFNLATSLLAAVRADHAMSLEEGVRLLTQAPANLIGLKDRGIIKEGFRADLVIFDAETIKPHPTTMRYDLPGGEMRLYAEADGIGHVIVNGACIVEAGAHTGVLPGQVLRSGRDTETRLPTKAA